MRSLSAVLVVAALTAVTWCAWAAAPTVDRPFAVMQGLDKVTARVSEFQVEVGSVASFGTLSLTLRACRETLPEETPETAAYLEVADRPPGADEETLIFSGWMFASSPALSALEHAIYDVWVIGCTNGAKPEPIAQEGAQVVGTPVRAPLSEAGIIPPNLPASRAGR